MTKSLQWLSIRNFFKIYFQLSGNSQYIYLENNTIQLFIVTEGSEVCFDFLKMFRNVCDIDELCTKLGNSDWKHI